MAYKEELEYQTELELFVETGRRDYYGEKTIEKKKYNDFIKTIIQFLKLIIIHMDWRWKYHEDTN